jgi:Uma2 family endonuclease
VYKETGVAVVWIVDTELRTVLVVRQGAKPRLFNDDEELLGDPELPGFRVAVAELFPF